MERLDLIDERPELAHRRLGFVVRQLLHRTLELDCQRVALTIIEHAGRHQTGDVMLEKHKPLLGWQRGSHVGAALFGAVDRQLDQARRLRPIDEFVDVLKPCPAMTRRWCARRQLLRRWTCWARGKWTPLREAAGRK